MKTICAVCLRTPAQFACSCAFPSVPVCADCLAQHTATDRPHSPTPIKKARLPAPSESMLLCDICGVKPALRFCLCTASLGKHCEDCEGVHISRDSSVLHFQHPISAYGPLASRAVRRETFTKKQQFLHDLKLQLGLQLVQFDAFVSTVEQEFDTACAQIATARETALKDLRTQRGKLANLLNTAQETIEAKRYEESFVAETGLEEVILTGYQSRKLLEEKAFAGVVNMQGIQKLLDKAVTLEVVSELFQRVWPKHPLQIPVIKGDSIRLYHPKTLEMTQSTLNATTRIDHATAYCYIGRDVVLCCGGSTSNIAYHSETYEVNVTAKTAIRVANMTTARGYIGIWKYGNACVYVFGGIAGYPDSLDSAEKYSLEANAWSALRNPMQRAKNSCSVCEHRSSLYITGRNIEHYDPQSERFTLLWPDSVSSTAILCASGDSLYRIYRKTIERGEIGDSATAVTFTEVATIGQIESGEYWLCCPVQWYGGQLISVLNLGVPKAIFRFNVAKTQFARVATFEY